MKTTYKVLIDRTKPSDLILSFLSGEYEWKVRVYEEQGKDQSEQIGFKWGSARTMESAKRKALKQVLKMQKEVDKGITYGLVFHVTGDVEDMKKRLG